ncbi:MAG: twin-arginine translocase subunit TatC [Anaerolineae bacterium]|nr:MAG: twin-arginine translocase subunit TatC [Anaerolineae bacterium]
MRKFFRLLWRLISAPFRPFFRFFLNLYYFFSIEPEDAPIPEAIAKTIQQPRGLLEHLTVLRKHLFYALIALVITTGTAFAYLEDLVAWLTKPIGGIQSLQAIEVTEPLGVAMRVVLLAGFAAALPYIAFEFYLFAAPGLTVRGRIRGLLALPLVTIFFLAGMAFAYYVMLPAALPFLIHFLGIPAAIRPASYIRFTTGLMFWIGVAFQFPLVIYALAAMGLVKARMLAEQWRLAVVLIAVLAAAITPTIDPINMALVMGPMIVLYFLSIGLAYLAQGGRARNTTD